MIVVGPRGRLLADSAGTGLGSASYASRPEIARALRGEADQGTRHSDTLGEDVLFTAVPVVRGDRTVGAVRVTQSVDTVQQEVRSDTLALVGVGALALLLGLGVAWLLLLGVAAATVAVPKLPRRWSGCAVRFRSRRQGSSARWRWVRSFVRS